MTRVRSSVAGNKAHGSRTPGLQDSTLQAIAGGIGNAKGCLCRHLVRLLSRRERALNFRSGLLKYSAISNKRSPAV